MVEPRLSPEEIERMAQKRAGAKLGWYMHAAVYAIVNAALFALSMDGWGHRQWTPKPMLFWGIGLVLHWVSVFVLGKGGALRDRLVRQERERIERQQRQP